MFDDMLARLTDAERRIANVIRIGTVWTADYAAATARVRIGDIVTAPMPWLTTRAGGDRSWWAPEVGEQVLVLAPSGELAQSVVLPSIYATAAPAPAASAGVTRAVWGDGLIIEHDRAAKLTRINALDSGGTLVLEAKNIVLRSGEDGYYHLDHAGYAARITHMGGANFETDNWKTGATVVGNPDQGFNPPEVLTPEE